MSHPPGDVPVVDELAERLTAGGHEVALVGGTVRDALLGRVSPDLDFATSARPEEVLAAVKGWADATWETGIAFGTVGIAKDGYRLEVTTYRAESYDRSSRNPTVEYGDTLEGDLARRDFTINAMAVRLPDRTFVDKYGGREDLAKRRLRTPGRAEDSFDDDPLRIMRAARFVAQLGDDKHPFVVADDVVAAMRSHADRLAIVSVERIRDELTKTVVGAHPRRGLTLLVETGVAEHVMPELPKLKATVDEHRRHKDVYEHTLTVLDQAVALERERGSEPDFVTRMAALLHDIGKPKTRKFEEKGGVSFHHHEVVGADMARARLQRLRYPKQIVEDVATLVELHLRFHGYAEGEWTDKAVRRYVRDAGPLLERLHVLTRSDCTTRNKRKAAMLKAAYDDLEARIARLAEVEELAAIRPPLDGKQVMDYLAITPGPLVGEALSFLLELRIDRGPMSEPEAYAELRAWAAERGVPDPGPAPAADQAND
ncbi:MAG: poly(A) polymerase [Frankiales bacterium]|nr:poly(A) polymerase [Frankiales bacterium]